VGTIFANFSNKAKENYKDLGKGVGEWGC